MKTEMNESQKRDCVDILKETLSKNAERGSSEATLEDIFILWEESMITLGISWKDIQEVYDKLNSEIENPKIKIALDGLLDLD